MSGTRALRKAKRMRFAPLAVAVGVASAALLGMSTTGTLSAFVASINNDTNTASSGTLVMQEKNSAGTVTCQSDATTSNPVSCSTINKFGNSVGMVPDASGTGTTTTVKIGNAGNAQVGSFTLTPSACTQSNTGSSSGSATDFCSKMNLIVKRNGTIIYPDSGTGYGTLANFGAHGQFTLSNPPAPSPGTPDSFAFTVWLDSGADSTYEGKTASVPMTWTFTS